jgi:hypothetical protein
VTVASTVAVIKPNLLAIDAPEVLRALPGWLMWRFEQPPDPNAKPRKVPYYTSGRRRAGAQGSPEDRQQLTTFEAAKAAAARRGFDGIGLALMPEWGVAALDFDGCVGADGLPPSVRAIVGTTYAEWSPSGQGVRAFVRGNLGNYKDNNPGQPFGFEVFSSKGFVTFTGNRLDIVDVLGNENTVAEAGDAVRELCMQRFRRVDDFDEPDAAARAPLGLTEATLREALDALPDDLHYDTWVKVGMAVHHETRGAGFAVWDDWSSRSPKYGGSEYGQARWDSFGRSSRQVTAQWLVHMANQHGARINLAELAAADFDAVKPAEGRKPRFQLEPLDVFTQRPAPSWIIKGVLPAADLIVLFGESGAGKSFMALELAAAIARGVEWRGRRVKQGRVVYVAAEGAGGFRNRVVAYCREHELDPASVPITVVAAAPNLLQREDALDLAADIVQAGGADLIIVDTFAQTTPGANENAAEDMGLALGHCKGLRRATGAPVLLVHHSGKDQARGARGWSGLKAAADAELEVLRTPGGRFMRTSKQKDGEDGLEWGFDLKVVSLGFDADGDEITSCVAVEAAVPVVQRIGPQRRLGKWEQHVVAAIAEIAGSQTAGIEVKAVLDLAIAREPEPDGRDTRRQHATRALNKLLNEDDSPYFSEDDGTLSIG